jgi:hypothetical protein
VCILQIAYSLVNDCFERNTLERKTKENCDFSLERKTEIVFCLERETEIVYFVLRENRSMIVSREKQKKIATFLSRKKQKKIAAAAADVKIDNNIPF